MLAENPEAMAELRTVNGQLQAAVEPAGGHAVVQILAPMLALYGIPRKTESEAEAFWGFYIDVLGDLPAEALRDGVAAYVADPKSEFFPKPGPLKAICERFAIKARMAASRSRKALESAA